MSAINRVGDLEIDEDMAFQRRLWSLQRVGWVVLWLAVAAALLGFLGSGPLSSSAVGDDRLLVEYDRFWAREKPARLNITFGGTPGPRGFGQVWLSNEFVRRIDIEQISPQPDSVLLGEDRRTFLFRLGDGGGAKVVSVRYRPEQAGWLQGKAGLVDGPEVSFRQWIYP